MLRNFIQLPLYGQSIHIAKSTRATPRGGRYFSSLCFNANLDLDFRVKIKKRACKWLSYGKGLRKPQVAIWNRFVSRFLKTYRDYVLYTDIPSEFEQFKEKFTLVAFFHIFRDVFISNARRNFSAKYKCGGIPRKKSWRQRKSSYFLSTACLLDTLSQKQSDKNLAIVSLEMKKIDIKLILLFGFFIWMGKKFNGIVNFLQVITFDKVKHDKDILENSFFFYCRSTWNWRNFIYHNTCKS